ncbi:hypothetical protein A2U01_0099461, partial [Trifolium medium]|nr:hypothetical protein [Trifolium medium]
YFEEKIVEVTLEVWEIEGGEVGEPLKEDG